MDGPQVDVMATSMALRTLAAGSGNVTNWRRTVYVQRFRHMLVLWWHLGTASDLMAPGFQLERALTGGDVDDPLEGLGSSLRLQLGTVGQSRTLVCAEVDAVDDEGAVVEIKSSPKVSADHQVQNMLCGVSTKIAAVDKQTKKDGAVDIESLLVRVERGAFGDDVEPDCTVYGSDIYGPDGPRDRFRQLKTPDDWKGVSRRGQRVRFLLAWLREHPQLIADGSHSPAMSDTFVVQFDSIGNPSLLKRKKVRTRVETFTLR